MPTGNSDCEIYAQVGESMVKLSKAIEQISITTEEAVKNINHFFDSLSLSLTIEMRSNNWRKLHGIPMRRRRKNARGKSKNK